MRYTKTDVVNTFDMLVRVANRAGVDSTAWGLHFGSSTYGTTYKISDTSAQSTVARLSTSRSESVALMRAMADAFRVVAFTREDTLK